MASSKAIFIIGLVFTIVLLISSDVSARELAQPTDVTEAASDVHSATPHKHEVEKKKKKKHFKKHHKKHHKPGHGGADANEDVDDAEN